MFYFSDNSLILCYSSCFCLVLSLCDSISSEKLNGHRAFEFITHFSFETLHFIIVMITNK